MLAATAPMYPVCPSLLQHSPSPFPGSCTDKVSHSISFLHRPPPLHCIGGAMMDAGCYCSHVSRSLAAAALGEPRSASGGGALQLHVLSAAAKLRHGSESVDGTYVWWRGGSHSTCKVWRLHGKLQLAVV